MQGVYYLEFSENFFEKLGNSLEILLGREELYKNCLFEVIYSLHCTDNFVFILQVVDNCNSC